VAHAPPCLTCAWRMRGARWGAKSLKIKGFSSDMTSQNHQNSDSYGHMRPVRTDPQFMHVNTYPPKRIAHTAHPPAFAHHTHHASASHHVIRTQQRIRRITRGFRLIRFALPMSKKVIRFELFSDRPKINTLKGKKSV